MNDVCKTLRRDLELYAEGELHDGRRERRVRRHLDRCPTCRRTLERFDREVRLFLASAGQVLESAEWARDEEREDWGAARLPALLSSRSTEGPIERTWARILQDRYGPRDRNAAPSETLTWDTPRRPSHARVIRAGACIAAALPLALSLFLVLRPTGDESLTRASFSNGRPPVAPVERDERGSGPLHTSEPPSDLSRLVWHRATGRSSEGAATRSTASFPPAWRGDHALFVSSGASVSSGARNASETAPDRTPVASAKVHRPRGGPPFEEVGFLLELRVEDDTLRGETLWLVEEVRIAGELRPRAGTQDEAPDGFSARSYLPVRAVSLGRTEASLATSTGSPSRRFRIVRVVGPSGFDQVHARVLSEVDLAVRPIDVLDLGSAFRAWSDSIEAGYWSPRLTVRPAPHDRAY